MQRHVPAFYPATVFNFWKFLKKFPETIHKIVTLPEVGQGSSTGSDLPPQRHLAILGDIFGCHSFGEGRVVPGIYGVEAWDAAIHPTWHRKVPPQWRIFQPQMSIVLRLRNLGLGLFLSFSSCCWTSQLQTKQIPWLHESRKHIIFRNKLFQIKFLLILVLSLNISKL